MGIGDAYLGLVDLLSHNGKMCPGATPSVSRKSLTLQENCTDSGSRVECLIGFVAETTIQSIKRAADDFISTWYFEVSKA